MESNLKAIELKDLWRRYKDDQDEQARERLVLSYAPLVKYVSGRMSSGALAAPESLDAGLSPEDGAPAPPSERTDPSRSTGSPFP